MRFFRDKRVFITGGSSGIGKSLARQLVASGARVVIAARDQGRLDDAMAEISALGGTGRVSGVSLDVGDELRVQAAAPQVLSELGGLDLLINNAGSVEPGRFEDQSSELFDSLYRVNALGPVHVTRAFLDHFRNQQHGHVCNVGSMLGFMGVFGYSAYAASKFAVTGFTECLRQELLPFGVGVSIVFPPNTDTPQYAYEKKNLPAETHAITRRAGVLSADAVARATLRGIARNRIAIVPGVGARLTWTVHRFAPWAMRWAMDFELRRAVRARRRQQPTPTAIGDVR